MSQETPKRSVSKIIGWVLTVLLTAFMIFSCIGKFTDFPGKTEMFAKLGWSESVMFNIGILEVIITLLFVVPQTAALAAILITAYLGGAIATHVRINEDFLFPIIIGMLYWLALGLRDARVFTVLFGYPKIADRESP